jgi:hypothetical protein
MPLTLINPSDARVRLHQITPAFVLREGEKQMAVIHYGDGTLLPTEDAAAEAGKLFAAASDMRTALQDLVIEAQAVRRILDLTRNGGLLNADVIARAEHALQQAGGI